MFYYESSQPELYQGRNLDDVYHRFAHRNRVEFVDAYDQAMASRPAGPFRRQRFHRGDRFRKPGRGNRQHDPAGYLLRSGHAFDTQCERVDHCRWWMNFSAASCRQATTFVYYDEPRLQTTAHPSDLGRTSSPTRG